jgi:hypothetical protein
LGLTAVSEIQIDVAPSTLHVDGHTVPFAVQGTTTKRSRDPLATALFQEGIRRITFLPTVTETEATTLLGEWVEAANQPLGGNVASTVWEIEPKGLKLVLLDTFDGANEGGDGTGLSTAPAGTGRTLSVSQQIDSLVSAIAAEGLAADGTGGFVSQGLIQVSADDIALLRSESLRNITAADLAVHESAKAPTQALEERVLNELRQELEQERDEALARLPATLLNAAVLNEASDWEVLTGLFDAFVKGAFAAGQRSVPLNSWQRMVAETKADPVFGTRRVSALKVWKPALTAPAVLEALVQGLDEEAQVRSTLEALRVLGKVAVPTVLKFATAARTDAGKRAALEFIREVDPAQVATSAAAMSDPSSLSVVVNRLPQMSDAEACQILEGLLASTDVQARRIGAKALNAKRAPLLRHQLVLARLQDNDAEVRMAMLKVAIALEDPSTLAALMTLAKRPKMESPELDLVYEALAVTGAPEARSFLVEELHQGAAPRRVAAAVALGASTFSDAKAVLSETAGKLLTAPALKKACRAALERLAKRGFA